MESSKIKTGNTRQESDIIIHQQLQNLQTLWIVSLWCSISSKKRTKLKGNHLSCYKQTEECSNEEKGSGQEHGRLHQSYTARTRNAAKLSTKNLWKDKNGISRGQL
jgi:hypothetical protein